MSPHSRLEMLMQALGLYAADLLQGKPVGLRVGDDQWLDLRFDTETGRLTVLALVGSSLAHSRAYLMAGLLQVNATLTAASTLRLGMEHGSGRVALGGFFDLARVDADIVQTGLHELAQACRETRKQLARLQLLDAETSVHPDWM